MVRTELCFPPNISVEALTAPPPPTLTALEIGPIGRESESESHSVLSDFLQSHGLFSVHGILQARILEWVAFPFSRGCSQPRD